MQVHRAFSFLSFPFDLCQLVWRRIKDPLLQDMYPDLLYARNRHRSTALKLKYQEMLESHATPDLFPSLRTFLEFPSVKDLWEETVDPLPDSIDVGNFVVYDDAKWVAALPDIQADVLRYQQELEALAISRLTAAYEAKSLPVPCPADIFDDPRSLFCYSSWAYMRDKIILPFPAIHREIRDRFKEAYTRLPRVEEFMTLEEPGVVGGRGLHVELKLAEGTSVSDAVAKLSPSD